MPITRNDAIQAIEKIWPALPREPDASLWTDSDKQAFADLIDVMRGDQATVDRLLGLGPVGQDDAP